VKVSCLIPFRDADGTRTQGMRWILARWKHHYPDWEFIVASDDGIDPFNKSMAVNKAAAQATGDVYVILDADTWIEPQFVTQALGFIKAGVPWVVPARTSLRLKKDVSDRIMALDPTGPLPSISNAWLKKDAEQAGGVVGFLWITSRKAFEAVGGMDERIRGWGGEDTLFTMAMDRVNGHHRKLNGIVMCLWHDRPRDAQRYRIWVGQDRSREQDKEALAKRYRRATTRPAMLALLGMPDDTPVAERVVPTWKRVAR
jgi:hypothetical protein